MNAEQTTRRRARMRGRLAQMAAVLVAGGLLGATVTVANPSAAQAAGATQQDSHVTVEWGSGNVQVGADATATAAEVTAANPDHKALTSKDGQGAEDGGSGHWDDFKNLSITVGQTASLADQAVTVTIAGMAATEENWSLLSNFVQLMQCWGPNPNAADFMETCQFGSFHQSSGELNAGTLLNGADPLYVGSRYDRTKSTPFFVPFRTVFNQVSEPREAQNYTHAIITGTSSFFTSATSNEQPVVQISDGASTSVQFETQSATSQPYLGCGADAGPRCWLVAVPRGTHSGTLEGHSPAENTDCGNSENGLRENTYGGVLSSQYGSPMDSNCSFWQDRIVVPLDFQPTVSACPAGAAERRLLGTELVSRAMSSWQNALCTGSEGAIYSLSTTTGATTRSRVISGDAGVGLTLQAAGVGEVTEQNDIRYAPVANTAITFAFISQDHSDEVTDITLSPRLIAKMLTMTYKATIPWVSGRSERYDDHLDPDNAQNLGADPEFQELNPEVNIGSTTDAPVVVMVGPQGEDAVEQLWKYLQTDDEARAFLQGQSDPWGQTINCYFLPATNPKACGGGLGGVDLSKDAVDTFPKADQTTAPDQETANRDFYGRLIDATAMAPYVGSFEAATRAMFRGSSSVTTQNGWDNLKENSAGEKGGWSSAPLVARVAPGKHLIGATSWSSAARYGLSLASLQLPNSDVAVKPTDASVAAGLTGGVNGALTTLTAADATAVPQDGYPLTTTVYAMADVASASLDDGARAEYGHFLEYAAADGQTRGELPGQLPAGYVPLTTAQRAQTLALAGFVRHPPTVAGQNPGEGTAGGENPGGGTDAGSPGGGNPGDGSSPEEGNPGGGVPGDGAVTASAQSETEATTGTGGAGALGATLLASVAGLAASPFLLRRQGADQ